MLRPKSVGTHSRNKRLKVRTSQMTPLYKEGAIHASNPAISRNYGGPVAAAAKLSGHKKLRHRVAPKFDQMRPTLDSQAQLKTDDDKMRMSGPQGFNAIASRTYQTSTVSCTRRDDEKAASNMRNTTDGRPYTSFDCKSRLMRFTKPGDSFRRMDHSD